MSSLIRSEERERGGGVERQTARQRQTDREKQRQRQTKRDRERHRQREVQRQIMTATYPHDWMRMKRRLFTDQCNSS